MNVASLKDFSARLRKLPQVVANKVAAAAAPALTDVAMSTFNASQNAYGESWVPGAEGQTITLNQSGTLAKHISYVAIGSKLRVALGVPYAKYQVGRRPVFPKQGDPLPQAYAAVLESTTARVIYEELGQ